MKGHLGWLPEYPEYAKFVVLPWPPTKSASLPVLWMLDREDVGLSLPSVAAIDIRGIDVNKVEDIVNNLDVAFIYTTNRQWDNLRSENDDTVERIQNKSHLFLADFSNSQVPYCPASWPNWALWQSTVEGVVHLGPVFEPAVFLADLTAAETPSVADRSVFVGKYTVTVRKVE